MKIRFLLVLLAATNLFATGVNFGFRSSIGLSSWLGSDAGNAEANLFTACGMSLKIQAGPVAIVPEFNFEVRSVDYEFEDVAKAESEVYSLNIPVLVRMDLLPILYVEAGPFVGFNVSGELTYEYYNYEDYYYSSWYYDDVKNVEIGLTGGVGFKVLPRLDIEVRFVFGLTDVYKDLEVKTFAGSAGVTWWWL